MELLGQFCRGVNLHRNDVTSDKLGSVIEIKKCTSFSFVLSSTKSYLMMYLHSFAIFVIK